MSKQNSISEPKIKDPSDFPTMDELQAIVDPEYKPQAYSQEELEELLNSDRIKNMIKWIEKIQKDHGKEIPTLDDIKAYPNNESQYMSIPGQRNIDKWLEAIKSLLAKQQSGIDNKTALSQITSGWNPVEVGDFIHWFRYYQEGAHLKYKYAQSYFYGNADIGYLIPNKQTQPKDESSAYDVNSAKDEVNNEAEKKQIIEKQRNKIIGRLDSAEKLLRSNEGQLFSGREFESLLEAIYDLKKRIQLINKKSLSTTIYEDLIVRQANILSKGGFVKAAQVLYSVAEEKEEQAIQSVPEAAVKPSKPQDAPKAKPGTAGPPPASPAPPGQGSGAAGGLPASVPGSNAPPGESAPNNSPSQIGSPPAAVEAPKSKGINDFFKNLKAPNSTDSGDTNDILEVEDTVDDTLTVEAQAMPDAPPPPPPAPPKAPEAVKPVSTEKPSIEVSEKDVTDNKESASRSQFDSKIDIAFANLKVDDVVAKLEDLAKIFKTREVPRQLSIVDMMLDSLGLASYFPSLSEATNKALESNNYISTRVEDILSKLRGAMATHNIDLKGGNTVENPEVAAIKNKLQSDTDKEKARKEMRKEQQNQELEDKTKETPDIEVEEDLTPAPAAPAAPPPPPAAKPPAPVV
jgi:hypothetical protein